MKISIITATHHRPEKLSEIALPSLLAQTNTDFEWIVINDGGCTATSDIIKNTNFPFEVTYQEMPHPTSGFGLCHARNLGLELASGQAIAYLDDDNWLYPSFVATMSNLLEKNRNIKCCLPSQNRSRMIIDNKSVQAGKSFVSPKFGDIEALIEQKDLFDSNGFVHPKDNAPSWNPEYKIFCDYEYFLQCLDKWGADSFQILPTVLVNYMQTSEGIIGQSKYSDWVAELKAIARADKYKILDADFKESLDRLSEKYKRLSSKCDTIQAFVGQ